MSFAKEFSHIVHGLPEYNLHHETIYVTLPQSKINRKIFQISFTDKMAADEKFSSSPETDTYSATKQQISITNGEMVSIGTKVAII